MQRADCDAHSKRRASALPITMLLAERFNKISAPPSAATVDGGSGTQTSSQISIRAVNGTEPRDLNSRSVPNATDCRPTSITALRIAAPDAKWRLS